MKDFKEMVEFLVNYPLSGGFLRFIGCFVTYFLTAIVISAPISGLIVGVKKVLK
ncbi:MAG: hypothetical protein AAF620_15230 [Bacteroidota bacterium]